MKGIEFFIDKGQKKVIAAGEPPICYNIPKGEAIYIASNPTYPYQFEITYINTLSREEQDVAHITQNLSERFAQQNLIDQIGPVVATNILHRSAVHDYLSPDYEAVKIQYDFISGEVTTITHGTHAANYLPDPEITILANELLAAMGTNAAGCQTNGIIRIDFWLPDNIFLPHNIPPLGAAAQLYDEGNDSGSE